MAVAKNKYFFSHEKYPIYDFIFVVDATLSRIVFALASVSHPRVSCAVFRRAQL